MDRYTYRSPFDLTCHCGCPVHHNLPRLNYCDDGCHCRITCATQPMTVLAPQSEGAFFLDQHRVPWHVPALEPGHWDWSDATPVDAYSELYPASLTIADLLAQAERDLLDLIYRRP